MDNGNEKYLYDEHVQQLPRTLKRLNMKHQTNLTPLCLKYLPPTLEYLHLPQSTWLNNVEYVAYLPRTLVDIRTGNGGSIGLKVLEHLPNLLDFWPDGDCTFWFQHQMVSSNLTSISLIEIKGFNIKEHVRLLPPSLTCFCLVVHDIFLFQHRFDVDDLALLPRTITNMAIPYIDMDTPLSKELMRLYVPKTVFDESKLPESWKNCWPPKLTSLDVQGFWTNWQISIHIIPKSCTDLGFTILEDEDSEMYGSDFPRHLQKLLVDYEYIVSSDFMFQLPPSLTCCNVEYIEDIFTPYAYELPPKLKAFPFKVDSFDGLSNSCVERLSYDGPPFTIEDIGLIPSNLTSLCIFTTDKMDIVPSMVAALPRKLSKLVFLKSDYPIQLSQACLLELPPHLAILQAVVTMNTTSSVFAILPRSLTYLNLSKLAEIVPSDCRNLPRCLLELRLKLTRKTTIDSKPREHVPASLGLDCRPHLPRGLCYFFLKDQKIALQSQKTGQK